MKALVAMLAALLLAARCETRPPDPPPAPPPAPTVEPVPTVTPPPPPPLPPSAHRCDRAAARAEALGCPLRLESREQPWAEICRYYEDRGGIDMQADCIELATDCDAVRRCLTEDVR